jgi:hypothetical protein
MLAISHHRNLNIVRRIENGSVEPFSIWAKDEGRAPTTLRYVASRRGTYVNLSLNLLLIQNQILKGKARIVGTV